MYNYVLCVNSLGNVKMDNIVTLRVFCVSCECGKVRKLSIGVK